MYLAELATLSEAFREEPLLWVSVVVGVCLLAVFLIPLITYLIQKNRIKNSIYEGTDNFAEDVPLKYAIPNLDDKDEEEACAEKAAAPAFDESGEDDDTDEVVSSKEAAPVITEDKAEEKDEIVATAEDVACETAESAEEESEEVVESAEETAGKKDEVEYSDADVTAMFDMEEDEEGVPIRRTNVASASLREAKMKLSFKAKLSLSSDELKDKYSRLSNVIMSYKGVKEHMNRPADKFRLDKKDFLKFKIVGKKVNMFIAVDESDERYAELGTKFAATKGVKKGQKKKNAQIYTFSIKNDKGWRNAESMINEYLWASKAVKETRIKKLPNIDYKRDLPVKSKEQLFKEGEIQALPETLGKLLNANKSDE